MTSVSAGESILALYAAQFLKAPPPTTTVPYAYDASGEDDNQAQAAAGHDSARKNDLRLPGGVTIEDELSEPDDERPAAPVPIYMAPQNYSMGEVPVLPSSTNRVEAQAIPPLLQSLLRSFADQKAQIATLLRFTGSLSCAPASMDGPLTPETIRDAAEHVVGIQSGHDRLSLARTAVLLANLSLQAEVAVMHLVSTIGGHTPMKQTHSKKVPSVATPPARSPVHRVTLQPSLSATLEQIGGSFRDFLYAPQVEESLCSPRPLLPPADVLPKTTKPSTVASKRCKPLPRRLLGRSVILFNGMAGIVRFAGSTEFANGIMYGIELHEPHGKHSGTVHGTTYFTCAKNVHAAHALPYGVFVRETQIKTWL
ncbi:hypothetical protein SPRG_10014 [Saprolegnia parasitica CBS 223.65]|uniref:CAP-Gly domain-containing protein n=1 Tax=Saprolegnia parasitica (strain CBS 223.65) TaxID=695850 RepID=A0A067C9L5_SAPPC|nr:hypothetical protein SPRG_10014 [Saprolegnia parasitica CBS 223.65]KDO23206.1 hypothetical protein SPRG_10014 [Saprolegnia parasitica CBS 223.65]|eukprot:XP_012206157.1 hypothetical protein SPRG_10014 [Saprolegnia parasitica CBS 223.65]